MNPKEKEISYTITNSYTTLNTLTKNTKRVWLVIHGMGYLSRYFINYFTGLDPVSNYIIAPQAQSKYYLSSNFKHVGASWLTKENTLKETENILNYIDNVLNAEQLPKDIDLIVIGYSQGVSIAMRYVAHRQLHCKHLILHSGGIPKELTPLHFKFLNTTVHLVYGTNDEYLNEQRIIEEIQKAKNLFGDNLNLAPFSGKHIVNVDFINNLI
jgi:predicted esterase